MNGNSVKKAMSFRPSELLIQRFCSEYNVSKAEARRRFVETKKFLILCASDRNAGFAPSKTVDSMWHEFLLFSHEYFKFCEILGVDYLHHEPAVKADRNNYQKTFNGLERMFGGVNQNYWSQPSATCCGCSCSSCGSN